MSAQEHVPAVSAELALPGSGHTEDDQRLRGKRGLRALFVCFGFRAECPFKDKLSAHGFVGVPG